MKKLITLFATVVAVFALNVALAQTKQDIQKKYNEAAEKYTAKDFAAAIPLFEETIKIAEACPEEVTEVIEQSNKFLANSYFYAGLTFAKGGKFEQAYTSLATAKDMAMMSGDFGLQTRATTMMGNVYIAQGNGAVKAGDTAKAAEFFNKAYLDNSKNTKAGILAAQCYAKSGNTTESTKIYKEIIGLEKVHSKYAAAAASAKKAYSKTLLETASAAAAANNYEAVTKDVEEILAMNPSDAKALLLRVQVANNMKKLDDVIKYAPEAAAAQANVKTKSTVYYYLGVAYQAKENKAKAMDAYKQVVEGPNVKSAKEMLTALAAQE